MVLKIRTAGLLLLLSVFIGPTAIAQSRQQQKVDSAFLLFKKYFNERNADAIYNMAGKDFQNDLGIDAFSKVAHEQLFPYGTIRESAMMSFVNNTTATYKLTFANRTLQLLMNLDGRDKLQLFLFQQYDEPADNKTALVQTSNPMHSDADKKVDPVARLYIQKANTVGLCIGIIKGGQTTVYSYGETIKHNHKLPDGDSFFEIGALTKTFTATLLGYYVNEGKLKLTDPVTKYLPDSVAANPELRSVTLLTLINHTSGLPRLPDNLIAHATDAQNPYKDYKKQFLYEYLKTCKLNSKPGEQYTYSSLGVGLLGSILEGITGELYDQMVRETICRPLGMLSTSQYLNPLMAPRFVQIYNTQGDPAQAWDYDVLAASGALRSTMNDMLIFARANLHPGTDELSKAILLTHKITFDKDVKIGLAWHIIRVKGVEYYYHNSVTNGSNCFLAFNPEKGVAVIVLSNSAESSDPVGVGILEKME